MEFNFYFVYNICKLVDVDKLLLMIKVKGFEFYKKDVMFYVYKIVIGVNEIVILLLVFKCI